MEVYTLHGMKSQYYSYYIQVQACTIVFVETFTSLLLIHLCIIIVLLLTKGNKYHMYVLAALDQTEYPWSQTSC